MMLHNKYRRNVRSIYSTLKIYTRRYSSNKLHKVSFSNGYAYGGSHISISFHGEMKGRRPMNVGGGRV